jgi:23S rRNA (guanosine2251-2'-O)-methyltransferase|tara:strand:+ start:4326 stop:5057 length:732 start_codon:yes stop_codon:yes gene_type:complete
MQSEKTIFGRQAIIEAIEASKTISKVFIQRDINKNSAERLISTLENSKIPYSYVPIQKLNKLTPHNHQGVVAQLSEITFHSLEDLLETQQNTGLFVLLDGITDTRNMGAIIRSAAATKATAVVIPNSGSAQITGETIKTSAGGVFQIPICRVSHLKDALYLFQSYDIQSIVADEKAEQSLFDIDLTSSVAIVMGAEDKGVSQGVRKLCSQAAKLPILGKMDSYNVSVAAGMFLYEAMRQRLKS